VIVSADTNLFLYAANPYSPHHSNAMRFFSQRANKAERFLVCGLVLIEIYMQLRKPAMFVRPPSAAQARAFCDGQRTPLWRFRISESLESAGAELELKMSRANAGPDSRSWQCSLRARRKPAME
jgi:predicted nucleic acid-binding protein